MAPPLIGITTYGRNDQNAFHLPAEYVESLRRAGGIPVLIPCGYRNARDVLDHCDGLILSGGGDLDPQHYGGTIHQAIYMVDSERDRSELALVRQVVQDGTPTLAICRGTQVLNVALGGTLFEHLPDVVGDAVSHRLAPQLPTPHRVTLKSGSKLARMLSCTECTAVSWHHQAIHKHASRLEVVAHAPDGTIEAVELQDHPWLFAVQWHPELSAAEDPVQQCLFDNLVRAASACRPKSRKVIRRVKGSKSQKVQRSET